MVEGLHRAIKRISLSKIRSRITSKNLCSLGVVCWTLRLGVFPYQQGLGMAVRVNGRYRRIGGRLNGGRVTSLNVLNRGLRGLLNDRGPTLSEYQRNPRNPRFVADAFLKQKPRRVFPGGALFQTVIWSSFSSSSSHLGNRSRRRSNLYQTRSALPP